jgi:sporulation inhibitor KapD
LRIKGLIHSFNANNQTITIKYNKSLKTFYFQRGLFKKFKRFLSSHEIIDLVSYDEETLHNGVNAYQVMYVVELTLILPKKNKTFYDKSYLNKSMLEFFKGINNKLFIDIEMTMPNYNSNGNFTPELIQAGFFLVNKNDEIVEKYNYHVRPTKAKYLNKRTKKFLHLEKNNNEEVSYYKFYNKFKALLNKYKPAVITFGKNDKLFLESSYKLNNLPSLTFISRFVNLSHIIKNYYELKNDPGLFNLYESYYGTSFDQDHDAYEDAVVTKKVYDAFLLDLENGNYKMN